MLAIVVIGLIIFFVLRIGQPTRSVAAYCSVYKQEKSRLSRMSSPQNAYPSGVYNVTVNDAGQIAQAFGELDKVAPTDIEPGVKTLRALYQDMHDDPAQAVAASLSGGSIDDSLKTWTVSHCSE